MAVVGGIPEDVDSLFKITYIKVIVVLMVMERGSRFCFSLAIKPIISCQDESGTNFR